MIKEFAGALSTIFTSDRVHLLHVIVPAHVYGHTLALLRSLGDAGPAPRPVWVVADPSYGPSRGWPARARALAREHGAAALQPAGGSGAQGTPADLQAALEPRDAFASAVAAHLAALPAGGSPVIVLAPQHLDDARAYARDIESLARHPALSEVRWVVLDPAHSSVGDLVERMGERASRVVWPEADAAMHGDLEALIADLSARSCGLPADLEAHIAPDSPLRAPDAAPLRRLLQKADHRFNAGDATEAQALFAQAEAALAARGMDDEAVHVTIARARTLLAVGELEEGQRIFVGALREAERRGMHALVPEAYASLGSLHTRQRRFLDALEAYDRAARSAERRGSRAFAADMHRCAGHAALNADMPDAARGAWRRAFELLGAAAPAVGALDEPHQIVVLGLSLADAFETNGNLAAARGLRGHAEAVEKRNPRSSASWS
jgi:tetratricopeptide (TPR) repeat protein